MINKPTCAFILKKQVLVNGLHTPLSQCACCQSASEIAFTLYGQPIEADIYTSEKAATCEPQETSKYTHTYIQILTCLASLSGI